MYSKPVFRDDENYFSRLGKITGHDQQGPFYTHTEAPIGNQGRRVVKHNKR